MKNKSEITELIKKVLDDGYLMSLATADDGGVWVADVIYIYDDDFNLYWMSHPDVRHSRALYVNPQVAGTITVNIPQEHNRGIQFTGRAQKIEGPRFDLAKKHLRKRGKPEPKEADDVLEGDSWYVLRPRVIELIDEKHFGFEKQKIEL